MRLFVLLIMLLPVLSSAQSADATFHMASGQYIHKKMQEAKKTLDDGLKRFPNDPKLNALRSKIKEEEKQDQQDQNQDQEQNQDQKDKEDQQKKDQNKDQQKNEDEQKKEQEQREKEKKEQEQKDQEQKKENEQKKPQQNLDPKKLPRISEEKARMILEAMKNQEKQYLQQQKRKATKAKEKGKPDW